MYPLLFLIILTDKFYIRNPYKWETLLYIDTSSQI